MFQIKSLLMERLEEGLNYDYFLDGQNIKIS